VHVDVAANPAIAIRSTFTAIIYAFQNFEHCYPGGPNDYRLLAAGAANPSYHNDTIGRRDSALDLAVDETRFETRATAQSC
jgi:hypothetical protein